MTNNKSISKYEWYNPDNVFILGVDNMDKLGGFLDSPFVNIDKEFCIDIHTKAGLRLLQEICMQM